MIKKLLKSKRYIRLFTLISVDLSIIIFSLHAAKFLTFEKVYFLENFKYSINIISLIIGIFIYVLGGVYNPLTRYTGSKSFYKFIFLNGIFSLILFFIPFFEYKQLKTLIVFSILCTVIETFYRLFCRDIILIKTKSNKKSVKNIAIYGAGEVGAQLLASIKLNPRYNIVTFVDDEQSLWERSINGVPIKSTNFLIKNAKLIDQVFLAIPSISNKRKKEIFYFLTKLKMPVLQIPSIDEIVTQEKNIDTLKPIPIEDLLGREIRSPNAKILEKNIKNSTILITGAGGSIGGEICRQLIKLNPSKIILFEISEINLYKINEELDTKFSNKIEIIKVLGNASNEKQLNSIFELHNVDFVFHAAAYKHVPIVELNPIEGIKNNIISTKSICKAVLRNNIKNFVLISTDKAVRPTNIMGASKRASELIVKSFDAKAKSSSKKSKFSVVRFGNVLDSSGSVIPLFRRQISEGGPITLTHEKVVRYFMTITEAAQLVLYASALAKGGDIFLLDMGKPIKIRKLAEQMIYLSGKTLLDKNNPNGDIKIEIIGLRQGEKLYEELLIEENTNKTKHPLIFKAIESPINYENLWKMIDRLETNLNKQDLNSSLKVLSEIVPGWQSKTFKIK